MRPLRGLQETRVATREESGVLGFPSRRHLEEGIATHTRILAWQILWTEERGGLEPIGLQRVAHD